jgi:hypothetical protein
LKHIVCYFVWRKTNVKTYLIHENVLTLQTEKPKEATGGQDNLEAHNEAEVNKEAEGNKHLEAGDKNLEAGNTNVEAAGAAVEAAPETKTAL